MNSPTEPQNDVEETLIIRETKIDNNYTFTQNAKPEEEKASGDGDSVSTLAKLEVS